MTTTCPPLRTLGAPLARLGLAGALALSPSPFAQDAPEPDGRVLAAKANVDEEGLALEGYDPVAYFPEAGSRPTQGHAGIPATFRGRTYRFASVENREKFLEHPDRYQPQYGGWCAWAMTDGDTVEVDPESFLVEEGGLLLFYDGFFADTRKKWLKKGGDRLRPQADAHWKEESGEDRVRDVSAFQLDGTLALGGHDPVSYRQGEAPVAGQPELMTHCGGATYRFATRENRLAFLKDPGFYEPRYGGNDALAASEGKRAATDPTIFLLDGGALYLFASAESRAAWQADAEAKRAAADRAWQGGLSS